MTHPPELALPIVMLVVFTAAKLFSELFERLSLPGLVGEILAGVLIGPSVLNFIQPTPILHDLSELGVLFLLFRVGLEVRSSDLLKVGGTAFLVAASGVIVPFVMGWAILRYWGFPQVESIFVGAALVATSVGITAQVLSARHALHERASQIILAAAVIDDVLGLIVLAVVSGVARGQFHAADIALTAILPIVFMIVLAKWGSHTVSRAIPALQARLRAADAQFHLAIVLLFALSVMALYTGIAAIVGAFLAGMALGENVAHRVHTLVHGTTELLVPFFLVGIGLQVELSVFRDSSLVLLTLVILAAAVASKLIGCGAGALNLGLRDATRIGFGMVPRGEVGMVVAQLGLAMGAISRPIYGVVVFTALATTIIAPPLLSLAYRQPQLAGD
ncbi:MAG: cation:proton antiporter [Acidobacteria bacterium]|nr:cation:proton antiporter [Acidobacteriota bacterium]